MSQRSCEALLAVLAQHYTTVGVTIVNTVHDLEALVACQPDLVFLGMKFVPDAGATNPQSPPAIWLADYLDEHGIAYTGSGQRAHQLELIKPLAKQRVLDARLKTPNFCVIAQSQQQIKDTLPLAFPLFVKPTDRGGGLGIDDGSLVHNFDQLRVKVRSIADELHSDSLIEEYLPGREFSVALLKNEFSPDLAVLPIELIAPPDQHGMRVLSGNLKSSNTEEVAPVTDPILKSQIITLAAKAFRALGARDYGRIDIRLDAAGVPQFLEANLIPSLISGYGSFPKACMLNSGIDYEAMILRIVRLGLARQMDDADNVLESSMVSTSDALTRIAAAGSV